MASIPHFAVVLQKFTWSNVFLSVVVAIPVILLLHSLFSKHSLRHIPVVGGSSLPVLSYLGAFKFNRDGKAVLEEGCEKYKNRIFKVAMFDQWLCVANGIPLNDEIQKIPDEQANFIYGVGELVGTRYIFRPDIIKQPYHVSLIRTQLTRTIAAQFDNIHDEIDKCFKEMIPAKEWTSVSAIMALRHMVARISSRVFVGAPLCYDPKYLYASTQFVVDFTNTRTVLNCFPPWTKPYVVAWLAGIKERVKEALEVIGPIIDERMRLAEKFGKDWEDKPNDMLQWIIDGALARGHTKWNMAERILLVNFTAIFTSSSSLSHAVHQLAAQPEFMAPLREEIERVVAEEGWTKTAMQKMRKLDSFMRENQRYNTINIGALTRQIRRDITLEDGTYLPKGTLLVTSSFATHFDSETYPDPYVFKPWRYVDMRDDEEDGNLKYHFATTSLDYIVFGHGKHSCPGRFFAVNELKAVMAYIIMNYDLKFADGAKEPEKPVIFMSILPDPKVEVLFKRRA